MCCLIPQYMIQRKVTLYLIQGKSKTSLSSPSIICPIQVHCGVHLVCESTGPKPINQVFSKTHATDTVTCLTRWQKLCEGTKGLCRKIWTRTKFLRFNIRYLVAILRFVAICALFGRLKARKVLFWVKSSVSWARSALSHGKYCIVY